MHTEKNLKQNILKKSQIYGRQAVETAHCNAHWDNLWTSQGEYVPQDSPESSESMPQGQIEGHLRDFQRQTRDRRPRVCQRKIPRVLPPSLFHRFSFFLKSARVDWKPFLPKLTLGRSVVNVSGSKHKHRQS